MPPLSIAKAGLGLHVKKDRGPPVIPFANEWSLQFDGADDYVQTSNITVGSSFSFSVWFNLSATPSNEVIFSSTHYHSTGYDGNFILRVTSSTTITFYSYDEQANPEHVTVTGLSLSTGVWYNVVVTCDGSTATLYLDGVEKNTGTHTKPLVDLADGGLLIGSDLTGPNNDFEGYIDEAGLWTSELSASDVLAICADSSAVPGDLSSLSPVGWWRMGDGQSPSAGTSTPGTVTDQGSGGANGTLNNALYSTEVPS